MALKIDYHVVRRFFFNIEINLKLVKCFNLSTVDDDVVADDAIAMKIKVLAYIALYKNVKS